MQEKTHKNLGTEKNEKIKKEQTHRHYSEMATHGTLLFSDILELQAGTPADVEPEDTDPEDTEGGLYVPKELKTGS